jgi:Fe2+ transport system protein FeoA
MRNGFGKGLGKGLGRGHNREAMRRFHNNRKCWKDFDNAYELSDIQEGKEVIIICNHDLKLIEMGLYVGSRIKVMRNSMSDPNIIIAVGESRYSLSREIANEILVNMHVA